MWNKKSVLFCDRLMSHKMQLFNNCYKILNDMVYPY